MMEAEAPLDVLHFLPKPRPAGPAASLTDERTFMGKIMPGAQRCWALFPDKYGTAREALSLVNLLGDSVANVFLCDAQSGLGEHKIDPEGDGKKCYCSRIYGERPKDFYKKFGYVLYIQNKYSDFSDLARSKLEQKAKAMDAELVFEDDDSSSRAQKEKRARENFAYKRPQNSAAVGTICGSSVREAVQRGQRLKVVFFPGEVMRGTVDMTL